MKPRLLGDANTSHKWVAACRRLQPGSPMVHLAAHNKDWWGLNDDDFLDACLAAGLILVAHDRRTLGDAALRALFCFARLFGRRISGGNSVPYAAFGMTARVGTGPIVCPISQPT